MRKLFSAAMAAVFCFGMAGCGQTASSGSKPVSIAQRPTHESDELQFQGPQEGDTIALFYTDLGTIRAVLYPELAPMATDNFIGLVEDGYYDGVPIHRIVPGFVVQSGDATGDGLSGSTIWHGNSYPIEITDSLHHYSGALAMAHDANDDTANLSQFYFVQALPKLSSDLKKALEGSSFRPEVVDAYKAVGGLPYLDGYYTVFGQIYSGMDVLDTIATLETDKDGRPLEKLTIDTVKIGTYDPADEAEEPEEGAEEDDASSQG